MLVDRLFEFSGLTDFLHFLDWACGLANTEERLAQLAYDFCQRLHEDGTGCADVIVNPTHWSAWRGSHHKFAPRNYGVSTTLWDHVFGTVLR